MAALEQKLDLLRPSIVRYGAGQLATLAEWIADRAIERPFVVSDAFNLTRLDLLGISPVGVFGDIAGEPDRTTLDAAVAAARQARPDAVIGFGGGSAMDLAKLVAVMTAGDHAFDDISGPNRAPRRTVPLVQVPTTAGTGSEVGTRALITDPVSMNKIATESPEMLADMAIIDPALTLTVPPLVTAATGIDALAHCVEAFTSRRAHPVVDTYALEGIRLVGRYLRRAVEDGSDIEARGGLALAAFYGGVCLGPVNTTAGHAIAYPLGTRFNIPHGIANALIFPHVLAINAPVVREKTESICRALGFEGKEILSGAHDFCRAMGLKMTLAAHGVTADSLPQMAQEAYAIRRLLDHNPRDLTENDILHIYQAAL